MSAETLCAREGCGKPRSWPTHDNNRNRFNGQRHGFVEPPAIPEDAGMPPRGQIGVQTANVLRDCGVVVSSSDSGTPPREPLDCDCNCGNSGDCGCLCHSDFSAFRAATFPTETSPAPTPAPAVEETIPPCEYCGKPMNLARPDGVYLCANIECHGPMRSDVTRYVCGFAFHSDNVLLIEKQRPAWQRGKWNGVGGRIEPGESDADAMCREFAEETSAVVTGWEHFATLWTDHGSEVVFFRAACPEFPWTEQLTDERPCWWLVNSLPATIPNLRWLIPMALTESVATGMPFTLYERGAPTPLRALSTLQAQHEALQKHLLATGDDAMRDLLRQYLLENDLLAETAQRLSSSQAETRRLLAPLAVNRTHDYAGVAAIVGHGGIRCELVPCDELAALRSSLSPTSGGKNE